MAFGVAIGVAIGVAFVLFGMAIGVFAFPIAGTIITKKTWNNYILSDPGAISFRVLSVLNFHIVACESIHLTIQPWTVGVHVWAWQTVEYHHFR